MQNVTGQDTKGTLNPLVTKHSSLHVSLQHVSHSLQLIMGKSVQNFAHLTFLHIRREKINK